MAIENKRILGDDRKPVDVTALDVGTSYELLSESGPDYVRTGRVGVILRSVKIVDTGDVVVAVSEQVRNCGELVTIKRVRLSSPVVEVGVKLLRRPRHRTLVPGVRP